MRILAIDTSGAPVSVAVAEDGKLLERIWLEHGRTHSETLMPCIEQTMAGLGLGADSFGAFAAVVGPGSFTGLRIGVSAIKAMAYARGVQTLGVSSLGSLAYNLLNYQHSLICPIIDARNDYVYSAIYRRAPNGGQASFRGTASEPAAAAASATGASLACLAAPGARHVRELAGEICHILAEFACGSPASEPERSSEQTAVNSPSQEPQSMPGHEPQTMPGKEPEGILERQPQNSPGQESENSPSREPGSTPERGRRSLVVFNGDAAAKYIGYFARELESAGCACSVAGERDLLADAASAALLACDMALRGEFTSPSALMPVYLRASQAERLRDGHDRRQ
ncbi:MAG: tRNA (adenosine(37)-N6)-threonylcarbamoyltransferase complex dimerization subunit type 1 TsaB [Clostridiales bacterium]|nr:tRNA (adenosine(37)-N6)-threonylcarbamoyltransferase complex dimerization subunit type 1 TsaB [Clostridiales bacterium]